MISPDLNARIVELEWYGPESRRDPYSHHARACHRRTESQGKEGTAMKFYAKYVRYAITALASVAFGLSWN